MCTVRRILNLELIHKHYSGDQSSGIHFFTSSAHLLNKVSSKPLGKSKQEA